MNDSATSAPTYFLTLHGSQHQFNRPRLSHTFATFSEQQTGPDGSVASRDFTISWLPWDGIINPLGPGIWPRWTSGSGSDWYTSADEHTACKSHTAEDSDVLERGRLGGGCEVLAEVDADAGCV